MPLQSNGSAEPSNAYRYVRYLREVTPSEQLEGLSAVIGEAALRLFGDKAAILKKAPAAGLQDGIKINGSSNVIGIPAVKIYPADRLRLTQFEILVSTKDVPKHTMLKRLDERSDEIIDSIPFGSDKLTVASSCVEYAYQSGYTNLGEEIVLGLDMSQDAIIIEEQNRLLDQKIRHKGPGNDLSYDFQAVRLSIPVGRLPLFRADQWLYDSYKLALQHMIQPYLPLQGIELCPIISAKK